MLVKKRHENTSGTSLTIKLTLVQLQIAVSIPMK